MTNTWLTVGELKKLIADNNLKDTDTIVLHLKHNRGEDKPLTRIPTNIVATVENHNNNIMYSRYVDTGRKDLVLTATVEELGDYTKYGVKVDNALRGAIKSLMNLQAFGDILYDEGFIERTDDY